MVYIKVSGILQGIITFKNPFEKDSFRGFQEHLKSLNRILLASWLDSSAYSGDTKLLKRGLEMKFYSTQKRYGLAVHQVNGTLWKMNLHWNYPGCVCSNELQVRYPINMFETFPKHSKRQYSCFTHILNKVITSSDIRC